MLISYDEWVTYESSDDAYHFRMFPWIKHHWMGVILAVNGCRLYVIFTVFFWCKGWTIVSFLEWPTSRKMITCFSPKWFKHKIDAVWLVLYISRLPERFKTIITWRFGGKAFRLRLELDERSWYTNIWISWYKVNKNKKKQIDFQPTWINWEDICSPAHLWGRDLEHGNPWNVNS